MDFAFFCQGGLQKKTKQHFFFSVGLAYMVSLTFSAYLSFGLLLYLHFERMLIANISK